MGPEDQYDPLDELECAYDTLKDQFSKLRLELSEYKKVAEENAQIANDRALVIMNLKRALRELEKKDEKV